MKIVLAGNGGKELGEICRRLKMWKLYSALNETKLIEGWPTDYPLIIDSGAFTWLSSKKKEAKGIQVKKLEEPKVWAEKYMKWMLNHDHKKWIFVELDCYAQMATSYIDDLDKEARSALKNAKYIRVYHTRCDGGTLDTIKKWLDLGHNYIGLSMDSKPLWDKIFALTRDKVKYHGFAVTKENFLIKYPFYSADSTTVLSTVRYGGGFDGIKKKDRKWLIKNKKVGAVRTTDYRQKELGAIAMKRLQDKVTQIWTERGVVWED